MNDRQRFLATMNYQPRDRSPICDFGFWDETLPEWHAQGLPTHVTGGGDTTLSNPFFGMDSYGGPSGAGNIGLLPAFEYKVVEDRDDHEVIMQNNGVLVLRKKVMSSIPTHLGHTLVDRASWNEHYKPRLVVDDPARMPKDLEASKKIWNDPSPEKPRCAWGGSLFGWLRDWMGMENLSYLVYDDPALFEEMVTTLADITVHHYTKLFSFGAKFDCVAMWEDMCYNAGPLLGIEHFKQYLVPHYKRITSLFNKNGTHIIWLDCDGKIDDLIPLWLDAGVNTMFPIEIGTWGADPVKYRREYGKDLLLMGGFDKHILQQSKSAIEKEIIRLAPLVEEGGFIPFPDHRVPPDVTYENYLFYLKTVRHIWGRDVNLKPSPALERQELAFAK